MPAISRRGALCLIALASARLITRRGPKCSGTGRGRAGEPRPTQPDLAAESSRAGDSGTAALPPTRQGFDRLLERHLRAVARLADREGQKQRFRALREQLSL